MNIKITADSTCDLAPEQIEAHGIGITPLYVIKGGKDFRDGVDIAPGDIFAHVAAGGELPTTSAVNTADYLEVFGRFSASHDAVIHINIGAGFSASHQNALLAAREFENVYVVDSQNISTGSGLVALAAAELADSGLSPAEIVEKLNELSGRVETSFVIDKLDYLRKGGRCSNLAALGANLLGLRPCIEVKQGGMQVGKKYKGSFVKCLKKYVQERLEGRADIDTRRIFITHTPCAPGVVEMVQEGIAAALPFDEVVETQAGCTVSSHCGPNTLGILFVRKA